MEAGATSFAGRRARGAKRGNTSSQPVGREQHYLPASVIGGFGRLRGSRRRTALMAVRDKTTPSIQFKSARDVAFEPDLYTLTNPPLGLAADVVEQIWTRLEGPLPGTFRALAVRTISAQQIQHLLFYVAACAARHPSVVNTVINPHRKKAGLPPITGDLAVMVRPELVLNTLKQILSWRWRVFQCSPDADPLVINDQGFCYVGEQGRKTSGLLVPLLPGLAVFGSDDQWELPFTERRTLTALSIAFVNHVTCLYAPSRVYGHPDTPEVLERIHVEPSVNRVCPFMFRHGGGFFD